MTTLLKSFPFFCRPRARHAIELILVHPCSLVHKSCPLWVAIVGNAFAFKNGRQLSAWLGLVPRQHSSGGKTVLREINNRGDGYIRRMLIHCARAVLRHSTTRKNVTSNWLHALSLRANKNVVIVAMANKLARIAWALLNKGQRYIEPAVG
ncbi:transposase [Neptuniibacter halophilus]|uniref:transposase n=1 Tax=Neptuniibacter halophilus TaxID=651666 RepID=UPI002572D1C0|nr:transposase [Neptuniibacter halophilus]